MSLFFPDLPQDHRSDWGAALAVALGMELDHLNPTNVTATSRSRRGELILTLTNDSDDSIEIFCWEDEALVRHGNEEQRFTLHRGRFNPDDGWIPDAVGSAMEIVRGWSVAGDASRLG